MYDHLIPSESSNPEETLKIGAIPVETLTARITGDLQNKYGLAAPGSLTLPPPSLRSTDQGILEYIGGLFESGGHIRISRRNGLTARLRTDSLELINWVQQIMIFLELQTSFGYFDVASLKLYELTWCGADAVRLLASLNSINDRAMNSKLGAFTSQKSGSSG